jgi:hypothetical protein
MSLVCCCVQFCFTPSLLFLRAQYVGVWDVLQWVKCKQENFCCNSNINRVNYQCWTQMRWIYHAWSSYFLSTHVTNSLAQSHKLTVAQLVSKLNLNVHYYVYKCPQLVPASSEINPVHAFIHYLCKIRCNTLLSVRRSPKWSLVCRLMTKTLY